MPLSDECVGSIYSLYLLYKRVTYVLGEMKQVSARFHHVAQNGMHFKTNELFISGIFHVIFLDWGWLTVGN